QPQELLSAQSSGDQWALGYVGISDSADTYKVNLPAGGTLTAQTYTPADGPGQFANTLNPRLRILDSTGTQVAIDDNSAAAGKNAFVAFPTPGAAGTFYVGFSPTTTSSTKGKCVLRVKENIVTPPPFSVAGTSPANGARLTFTPTAIS